MPEHETLSPKQDRALELIAAGAPDTEIARMLGVTRQSIYRWRSHNPAFIQALRERRALLREQHMAVLNRLLDRSLTVLEEDLSSSDPVARRQAALAVLRASGLQGYAKPPQSPSPAELAKETILDTLGEVARELGYGI